MPKVVVDRDSKVHMNECERLGQRLLGTWTSLPLLSVRRKTFHSYSYWKTYLKIQKSPNLIETKMNVWKHCDGSNFSAHFSQLKHFLFIVAFCCCGVLITVLGSKLNVKPPFNNEYQLKNYPCSNLMFHSNYFIINWFVLFISFASLLNRFAWLFGYVAEHWECFLFWPKIMRYADCRRKD